ncbi:hypothetical protein ACO0K8_03555 [Undibacterium sp. Ren11W]
MGMPPLRNTGAACRPDAATRRIEYARWRASLLENLMTMIFGSNWFLLDIQTAH